MPTHKSMMEAYRRNAKAFHGEKYRMRLAPYATIIALRSRMSKKDPVECAKELLGMLAARRPNLSVHVRALIYSAALEVRDGTVDK